MASVLLRGVLVSLAVALPMAQASAGTVSASIQYDTLGLDHTSWLTPASVSASDAAAVYLSADDLPPIDLGIGYNLHHTTYMRSQASSTMDGSLSSYVGLRAGGSLTAQSAWSDSFTNTTGGAQAYQMNFSIGGFGASLGGWTNDQSTRDYRASYEASILVNGVSVWSSSQMVTLTNGVATVSKSGVDIGNGTLEPAFGDNDYWRYSVGGYSGVANLGSFGAGRSFNVQYLLTSRVYWNDPNGCSYECGSVSAGVGDPFVVNGSAVTVAAVPEPETWALLLSGLGLMGGVARRRKQQA